MPFSWRDSELEQLRTFFEKGYTDAAMGFLIGRSHHAVKSMRSFLRLVRRKGIDTWSPEMDKMLVWLRKEEGYTFVICSEVLTEEFNKQVSKNACVARYNRIVRK